MKQKVRHPAYNAAYKQNDIALLQLDKPVPFNDYVRPACIDTQIEDVSSTTELIIVGWGSIQAKSMFSISAEFIGRTQIELNMLICF